MLCINHWIDAHIFYLLDTIQRVLIKVNNKHNANIPLLYFCRAYCRNFFHRILNIIGLALAKELIEMHSGNISVKSRYIKNFPDDHGAIFTVTLHKGNDDLCLLVIDVM